MLSPMMESMARTYRRLEKRSVKGGAGGWLESYVDGAEFSAYLTLDTSTEAAAAEKQGLSSVYRVLVEKSAPVAYGCYFKDTASGKTFRVTSDPDDKAAPSFSPLDLKFFTAEQTPLPGEMEAADG